MELFNYITTTSFIIGFIFGVVTTLLIKHEKVNTEKAVALSIFFVWLGLHVWGFVRNQEVGWIFDVVGAMAVGGLIGVNAIDVLKSLYKSKNGK